MTLLHRIQRLNTIALILLIALVPVSSPAQQPGSAREWFNEGYALMQKGQYREAGALIAKAWQAEPENGDYRVWHMRLSYRLGQLDLIANNHAGARAHFAAAMKVKQSMTDKQDDDWAFIKRLADLTDEHERYYKIKPDYVFRMQALYLLNSDISNSADWRGNPVSARGSLKALQKDNDFTDEEVLRVYLEAMSRGRLSITHDHKYVDTTLTRVLISDLGRQGGNSIFDPDLDSCVPSIMPILYAGRNTYDVTTIYWYGGNILYWPSVRWSSGVTLVPYTWHSRAIRPWIHYKLDPVSDPNDQRLSRFFSHWIYMHEFFHIVEQLCGNIGPEHPHLKEFTAEARKRFPDWKPDLRPTWGTTEYSWFRYHFENTVPRRMEELAARRNLYPAWRNMSYVLTQPDRTDELVYKTYTEAVKGIKQSDLQKASDLYNQAQQAYRAGKIDQAIELHKQALRHNPCHIGVLDAMGWLAIANKNNDFEMADKYYGALARVFPDPKNCFLYGMIFFDRGQPARAARYFRILADRPDANGVYAWWAARSLAAAGDGDGAESMMRRIDRHPVVNAPLAFLNCRAASLALRTGNNPEDEAAPSLAYWYRNSDYRWRLVPADDGKHVRIVSDHIWRCLEARGEGANAAVALDAVGEHDAQLWLLSRGDDGSWRITAKTGGLSLAVVPAAEGRQAALALRPASNDRFQKWEIETFDQAVGAMETLRTAAIISPTGMALDLSGGSMEDGNPICQWDWGKDNPNQKWKLVPSGTAGHVLIVSTRSLKCVAAVEKDGSYRPQQQTITRSDAQIWKLVPKNGRYLLVNRQSGQALQPDPWNKNDLMLGPVEDTAPQLWKIEY